MTLLRKKVETLPGNITVRLPGGELNLALGKDGHVLMTGPATRVFRGEL